MTISAYAAPVAKQQFTDSSGNFLSGGLLFTYAAGTTTKQTTYQDAGEITPNTNPIVLDAEGRTPFGVFLPPGQFFKFTLAPSTDTDPPTHAIWTIDNLGSAVNGIPYAVDTGITNALVATVVGVPLVATAGAAFLCLPANGATGACTINVNAWGAIAIRDKNGNPLASGAFAANQPMLLTYDGTYWRTEFATNNSIPFALDTGVTNALTATVVYGIPGTPTQGASFNLLTANPATSAVTLNANGWGAIAVNAAAGTRSANGAYSGNQIILFTYDGTFWRTPF